MNYNIYPEMKHKFFIIPVSFILAFFLYFTVQAQDAPPEWSVCSACHTIGKGRLVGPDLKGVTDKYSEEWLINFIRASQKMVKAGDKDAVKIFDEYKIPMPDNNLTDDQIKGLLAYIKGDKVKPAASTAGAGKTVKEPEEWKTCAACHTIGKGKLVGPDLKGITEKYDEEWLINFIRASQKMVKEGDKDAVKIFDEYKIPMPDHNYSDEQIKAILEYVKYYKEPSGEEAAKTAAAGETGEKPKTTVTSHQETYGPGNTKTTFYIFLALLFISLIDLGLTKIIKAKFIHYIVILTALFVIGEIVYVEAAQLGRQQGYSPDQPVWFSHKVHAGQNQIDCEYCHFSAQDSKNAGIPGTDVCMNCHNVVKKGTQTGEAEIAKVLTSWKEKKPIEWIKVHNLPDHVFFSHAQHVNAGKRECEECHGKVEEMDKVAQVNSLSMGWCLDCHRRTNVQFKENDYYKNFKEYHQEIKEGKRAGVTVEDIGGTDCSACHY